MVNVDNRPGGPRRDSNNTLYFIVGALVIAVLIIGWFMYGGDDAVDDTNVTVEEPAGTTTEPATATEPDPVEPVEPVTPEPAAPEPVEPAPAAPATPEPPAEPAPATPPAGTTP